MESLNYIKINNAYAIYYKIQETEYNKIIFYEQCSSAFLRSLQ